MTMQIFQLIMHQSGGQTFKMNRAVCVLECEPFGFCILWNFRIATMGYFCIL